MWVGGRCTLVITNLHPRLYELNWTGDGSCVPAPVTLPLFRDLPSTSAAPQLSLESSASLSFGRDSVEHDSLTGRWGCWRFRSRSRLAPQTSLAKKFPTRWSSERKMPTVLSSGALHWTVPASGHQQREHFSDVHQQFVTSTALSIWGSSSLT